MEEWNANILTTSESLYGNSHRIPLHDKRKVEHTLPNSFNSLRLFYSLILGELKRYFRSMGFHRLVE